MNGHLKTAFWALVIALLLGAYPFAWMVSQATEAKGAAQVKELKEDIVRRLERIEDLLNRGR